MMAAAQASKARLRGQAIAIRCARLRDQGLTSREIAKTVGKKPEQIRALELLGRRLQALEEVK